MNERGNATTLVDTFSGGRDNAGLPHGGRLAVRARRVAKSFEAPNGKLVVLEDIELSVARGEFVAITGVSGSGKSTLLHLLGALDVPDSGSVEVEGVDLFSMSGDEQAEFRNRSIGFVFQFHHLLHEFSAVENVMMPALVSGQSQSVARSRAMDILDVVKLTDRADHQPGELSGGEQQRVAVARALANSPSVVLADEPTGNLDPSTSDELFALFSKLRAAFDQTLVVVTHEAELAARADRVLDLDHGRLVPVTTLRRPEDGKE